MNFLDELKRRNVFKVAVAYALVAWLLIQLTSIAVPALGMPEVVNTIVFYFMIIGFPIALLLAWALEMTPEGVKRTENADLTKSVATHTGRKIDFAIIGALVLVVGFLLYGHDESSNETGQLNASIAVLPFVNMSSDEEQIYFSDGISEEILNVLAQIPDLHVTSRSSAFQFRGNDIHIPTVAQQLGVAHVLEGSVRKSGTAVRISAQLIEAESDKYLWSQTYNRELTAANIFDVQSDIALAIATALRSTLSLDGSTPAASTPTDKIAALEAYFMGKQLLNRRDRGSLTAAATHFELAIDLDPNYAAAHSGLADVYMLLPQYAPDLDRAVAQAKVKESVTRALALDPNLPEALASMAWYRVIQEYDWEGAEILFRRALDINPSNLNALHWMSHMVSFQGRHDEAIALAERALVIDPISPLMRTNLAVIMMDTGKYEAAIKLFTQLLEDGAGLKETRHHLWLAEIRMRRFDTAAGTLVRWATVNGLDETVAEKIGQILQSADNKTNAPQDLSVQLARWPANLKIAIPAYASIGAADKTIELLEQLLEQRAEAFSLLRLKISPSYDFLRDDPRFKALMHRVGLD